MATTLKFDRKAEILSPSVTRDADGGPETIYTATATRYCNRLDRSSRETRIFSALRSETVAVFTFHYFSGLTPEHRLRCEGRVYTIQPPRELGRRQFLEVEASEVPGT